jgi:lysophospholipase L1-like esterase
MGPRTFALSIVWIAASCAIPLAERSPRDGGAPSTFDGGASQRDAGASPARDGGPTEDAGAAFDGGMVSDAGADGAPPDASGADAGFDAGAPPTLAQRCFSDLPATRPDGGFGPAYDVFAPNIGSHCRGTNHQDIRGVERVVFLGDSVTVGTPPTAAQDVYRARLADALAARFGLRAPDIWWKSANAVTGEALLRTSGDFWSCAKWGARADDLQRDNRQIADCFPESERHKRTLVVMTMGGNDIASLQKRGAHAPYDESRARVEEFVGLMRDAVRWLKDPANVAGGVYVVFTNLYEYTDATGDIGSCVAAEWSGFTDPWDRPQDLERLVIWANEQYMSIAVETQSDLVFMLEHFCGHGFHNEDPQSRCYRGPGTERWFDLTCIHPSPVGHARLADMFMSVIEE